MWANHGLLTREEIETGKTAAGSQKATPPFAADALPAMTAPGAVLCGQMWKQRLVSKSESMCAPGTSIRWAIHVFLATLEAERELSPAATAYSCFRTRTRIFSASTLSTCIRCGLRRGNYGAMLPHRKIVFILTCGTAILSTSDLQADPERIACLPSLPRDHDGPVFAEPWQAQAFALAVQLSAQGYFTWKEWSSALADELKSASDRGKPDDGTRYYEDWLAALERLVTDKQ